MQALLAPIYLLEQVHAFLNLSDNISDYNFSFNENHVVKEHYARICIFCDLMPSQCNSLTVYLHAYDKKTQVNQASATTQDVTSQLILIQEPEHKVGACLTLILTFTND